MFEINKDRIISEQDKMLYNIMEYLKMIYGKPEKKAPTVPPAAVSSLFKRRPKKVAPQRSFDIDR